MTKRNWEKLQEFQNENKDLLVMFACPKEDAISISYGGYNTFVQFPKGSVDKGIVFNALRESKFIEAIEPFMEGLVKATGFNPEKSSGANELLKTLGGGMKSIGIAKAEEARSELQIINNKPQWPKRTSKKKK